MNWFLVCQLPPSGLLSLVAYIVFGTIHYTFYGASHSVGNCSGWSSLLAAAAAAAGGGSASPGTLPGCPGLTLSADAFADPLAGGSPVSPDGRPTAPLLGKMGAGQSADRLPPAVAARDEGGATANVSPVAVVSPVHNTNPGVAPHDQVLFRRRSAEGLR